MLLTILLCNSRNETPVFFNSPTLKMKLASVGIDPDYIGFPADYVSAELFDLLHFYSYLKQNHRFL